MIPLTLHIKNFLSYGADIQTIDFEPYNLICLSGKNGHGKSALLDAMTWALWGQARKLSGVAKANDGLMRLGQKHMMVTLIFMCNGQQYQICREYTKGLGGRRHVTLDFGLHDAEKNAYVPISGKSIRLTQAVIDRTLHLDFDSFCNSAFLRQGQSNEFSKKSPRDRKEVLGAILGIGQYEAVRRLASEKMRETTTERIALQAIIDRTQQELQQKSVIEEAIRELVTVEDNLKKEDEQIQNQEHECALQRKTFFEQKHAQQIVIMRKNELQKRKNELNEEIRSVAYEWRSVHAEYVRSISQGNVEQERDDLINTLSLHQEHMQQGLLKKEQLLDLKSQMQKREQELMIVHSGNERKQQVVCECLQGEKKMFVNKFDEIQRVHSEKNKEVQALSSEIKKLEKHCAEHSAVDVQIETINKQFEKRKAFYQQLVTEGNLFKSELANIEQKQRLSQDRESPSCPLCEQLLSAARRKFLQQKFAHDEQFVRHRFNRIARVLPALKNVLIEQHATLAMLQKERDEYNAASAKRNDLLLRVEVINKEIVIIEKDAEQSAHAVRKQDEAIVESAKELESVQKNIHESMLSDAQCCELKNKIVKLEAELVTHKDDVARHAKLREQLNAIEARVQAYKKLAANVAQQAQRMQRVSMLCVAAKGIHVELQEIEQKMSEFNALQEQEAVLAEQEAICLQRRKELLAKVNQLLHEKGSLESQRKKLVDLAKETDECKTRLRAIEDRIDDYQAIVAATGKDGIQALLIQDVLPEIEQEANALLARLTDNQSQIFIESLRDLKKGGAKETLDINISDGVGIRPYEMFSGGEAFRIDFALRIAMSKLLASRAGTSLQTLVIDEGFGSQDEEGLSYIMDALYKIQDDFAKIIVVSHLPSMKDQFPVHFHVEKKPMGSIVNVIEQG